MFDFVADLIAAPFNCILWLLVGFIAGAGARRIMQAPNYPFIQDVILGIVGAAIGGFLAGMFVPGIYRTAGFNLVIVNLVVATITACLLIAARRLISGKAKN